MYRSTGIVNMVGGPMTPNGASNWPARLPGDAGRGVSATLDLPLSPWVMRAVVQALVDRGRGVAHMDHERTAADRGAVDPGRRDAEVVGNGGRRLAGGGDAVDIRGLQAGVFEGIEGGVRVELDLGQVGDHPEVGRLGGTDDCNCSGFHGYLTCCRRA